MRIMRWTLQLLPKVQQLQLPDGAQILSVQSHYGAVWLWALCNPDAKTVERTICIYITGKDEIAECDSRLEQPLHYISTFLPEGSPYEFHAFERFQQ